MNRRLLIGATNLGLSEVIDAIHKLNGLAVAAHIDRQAFSIISQLGFIPEGLDLDAVEISKRMTLKKGTAFFKDLEGFAFITSSDAHDIEDIGSSPTGFQMTGPKIAELRVALKGEKGRRIEY